MTIGLIITAAGKGERFGKPDGKLFVQLKDHPLIWHTLHCFSNVKAIKCGVITSEPSKKDALEKLLEQVSLPFSITVVKGGQTRQESVYNAFQVLEGVDQVMVHDGARPYVKPALLDRLIRKGKEVSAVIPVIPVTDTIKVVELGKVSKTLPRETLFRVQTPQLFHYDVLAKAYQSDQKTNNTTATDEAMLVERAGVSVHVVEGDQDNIKVTTPVDLKFLTHSKRLRWN